MPDLSDYIEQHIEKEHPYLNQVFRNTYLYQVRPHMASGHLQGIVLRMLVQMIKPRRILEIGTYTGYSALSMASALQDGAMIDTYEINDELEDIIRANIANSPWAEKITPHIGDVLKRKWTDETRYNLVFIDGNKRQYADYYELALSLTGCGDYILADNTLWDGHIVDSAYDGDAQTEGIRKFNDLVAKDNRVEKVILPLRDGLTIMRVK